MIYWPIVLPIIIIILLGLLIGFNKQILSFLDKIETIIIKFFQNGKK